MQEVAQPGHQICLGTASFPHLFKSTAAPASVCLMTCCVSTLDFDGLKLLRLLIFVFEINVDEDVTHCLQ